MTVDEPIEESDVKDILRDVLIRENFKNAVINFQSGSKVGDGFMGITNAIEVKSDDKELKLFAKAAPKNKTLREALLSRQVFLKEIHFYTNIVPAYDKFLQERLVKPLNLTAKCYATNTDEFKEMLIFDNLKEQGFTLFNKREFLDEAHILLVLRAYAKYHGTSYAFKNQCPDEFQNLSEKIIDDFVVFLKHFKFSNNLRTCATTIKEHNNGKLDANTLDKLDSIIAGCYDFLEGADVLEDEHKIIIHGDCWMNNMLFKYKENGNTPTDIKLLDFQINRVSLPVFDLSYFFYCSAGTSDNLAKLDYYLEYYYKHLCEFLKDFDCNGQQIYPYELFKLHWKRFSKFGLMFSVGVSKMVLADADEAPNIAEMVNSGDDRNAFDIKLSKEKNDIYVERLKHILLHFVDNKFI